MSKSNNTSEKKSNVRLSLPLLSALCVWTICIWMASGEAQAAASWRDSDGSPHRAGAATMASACLLGLLAPELSNEAASRGLGQKNRLMPSNGLSFPAQGPGRRPLRTALFAGKSGGLFPLPRAPSR